MERKMVHLLKNAYAVTSNDIKKGKLARHGRLFIDTDDQFERSLVRAVGAAEGTNLPVLKDNDPEDMFVVKTSRRKAEGMIPLVQEHFKRTSDTRIFYAMDSVYTFRQPDASTTV